MAGRPMGKRHQDDVRAKIQAGQLIKTLQDHALGLSENELTDSRRKAIEILLKKSLPDLSSVTISGDADNPLLLFAGQLDDAAMKKIAEGFLSTK